MYKAVILADDLTGALDTGVQLTQRGVPALVCIHAPRTFPEAAEPVLIVNLDTRHVSVTKAFEKTSDAARLAKASGACVLYVKTDSGLRGNVGAALCAAIEGWGESLAFVPAYPENGRTVKAGQLFIYGVPVTKSVFGSDLHNPVRHDSVRDILREQCDLTICEAIKEAAGTTAELHTQKGQRVIHLFEAACEADMAAAAHAVHDGGFTLMSGCAGFSKYLPGLLSLSERETRLPAMQAPLMVLSGSTSEIALRQLRCAQDCGLPRVSFPDLLAQTPDLSALNARLFDAMAKGSFMLTAALCEDDVRDAGRRAHEMGLSAGETGKRIARNLGRAAASLLGSGFSGTLCVFGGDTLASFLCQAGATAIRPLGEISGGVVLSEIITGKYHGNIITKSGSFGSDEIIPNILAMLSKAQPTAKEGANS